MWIEIVLAAVVFFLLIKIMTWQPEPEPRPCFHSPGLGMERFELCHLQAGHTGPHKYKHEQTGSIASSEPQAIPGTVEAASGEERA